MQIKSTSLEFCSLKLTWSVSHLIELPHFEMFLEFIKTDTKIEFRSNSKQENSNFKNLSESDSISVF